MNAALSWDHKGAIYRVIAGERWCFSFLSYYICAECLS